jgi:3-oxoacyl-[acyl-carrier protein] reductase
MNINNLVRRSNTPVYLVIGATSAIGTEVCRQLKTTGGRVVPAGRQADKLALLEQEFETQAFQVDAAYPDTIESLIQQVSEIYTHLDGVVNCIGSLLLKPAHLTTEAEWLTTLTTNLGSAFTTVRAATKAMLHTGGSIVLVSSAAARIGLANHEAIAAAKAGIIGLTLSAAASYGARGIRVNCVAPGLVKTPLTARITENEAALKTSQAMHALGRIGEPADVASAIVWLLDPANRWVTGQVLGVDGGLGSVRAR